MVHGQGEVRPTIHIQVTRWNGDQVFYRRRDFLKQSKIEEINGHCNNNNNNNNLLLLLVLRRGPNSQPF